MRIKFGVCLASTVLAVLAGAQTAGAATVTVTFADASGDITRPLSDGRYAGFDWSFGPNEIRSIDVRPNILPANFLGWFNGVACTPSSPASSECRGAFNAFAATPTAIRRDEPFILNQIDLTSSLRDQSVEVKGYKAGRLKLDQGLELSRRLELIEERQTFVFNWVDVDEVRISSLTPNANQWVLDNLIYTVPVPEPSSAAYLLAGLGVLASAAALRRRS